MGLRRGTSDPAGLGWVRNTQEDLLGAWKESQFYSSIQLWHSSDVAIRDTCPSLGDSTLGLGWALAVSKNSRELSALPALSGRGIMESLGWEF